MYPNILLPTHPRFQDLTGRVFSRLTVISYAGKNKQNNSLWHCSCECGTTRIVLSMSLKKGLTRSCGCWSREVTAAKNFKHGERGTRLHTIWRGMRVRCQNKHEKAYKNYGGRGISVCNECDEDYENFRDWAMNNGYEDSLQIDRIDNDGIYEPNNCRWVTRSANLRNKRNNRLLTWKGETHCVSAWSEELNITASTLFSRLNAGWSVDRALSTKVSDQ